MQTLDQSRKELERAGAALTRMKEIYASPPIDVESDEAAWFAFLGALERVSYKCLSQMKGDPRCHSWAGRWSTLRKEDPLLSFLSKSRGAEEHSHLEVVERGVGIRDFTRRDGPMQYKDVDGTLVPQVVLGETYKIHLDPMTVKLKPLEYRGHMTYRNCISARDL
jgi:hypothetical protein